MTTTITRSTDVHNPLAICRLLGRAALVCWAVLAAVTMLAGPAQAEITVGSFGGSATSLDGSRLTQAGAHPDVTTKIEFELNESGETVKESAKNILVDLPPGLVGAPAQFEQCTEEQLTGGSQALSTICPVGSQVGTLEVTGPFPIGNALYNMKPPAGRPAMFAANILGVVIKIVPGLRAQADGSYRISADSLNVSQGIDMRAVSVTLWGVPADPAHDAARAGSLSDPRNRVPLITAPTRCSGQPLMTTMRADSWQTPGVFDTASFDHDFNNDPLIATGCEKLEFDPRMSVEPTSRRSGGPSGLDVTLEVPQVQNPDGLGTAHVKRAEITLPEGMVVNPSSAGGLGACSAAQIGLGSDDAPGCPESSKLGSISLHTPLIDDPLTGDVYLARQNDNKFNSLIALYIVARGPGLLVKIPGVVQLDPVTGRLKVIFDDNPEIPFDKLTVSLNAGPRAALTLPKACGPATTTAVLTPWSATEPVTLTSSFDVSHDGNGAACPAAAPFAPTFAAGAANPSGGQDSPFSLGFSRTDQEQELSGVSVTMPKGLLARISSVSQCADAAANAGTCGDGSKIGTVTTAAGAGTNPFSLPGQVYLTGPYKGAPFGLSIVVPAVAGPFDLGKVVVRAAISIDPITAQVTVVSDPLPTILQGIPLQVRLVKVDVDRPGFMINPTSCVAKSVDGSLKSTAGATAAVGARFQVGNCAALPLKPNLGLTLSGKGQTVDGKHPAVTATVTQKPGQANLKKVRVTLPLSLALDPDNAASDGLCSFVEGSKPGPKCPASSVVGKATAITPILGEPLSGPVYFVKNERKDPKSGRSIKTTPKLVIPLVGQNGLKLTLTGESTVVDDQLVTTFDNIPDAPVSSFKMDINGGKKGILVISGDKADICKSTQIADQQINGQNNRNANADVYIQTPSCPLKVLSKKVGKTSVTIKVAGLGAGKVTVTGRGIRKTTKTITKSTVATITAKRTKRTKGTPGKVTVSYDPTGPATARKTSK